MLLTTTPLIALPASAVRSASQTAGNDTVDGYRADIRRTAYGMKADGYGSLGFGYGYAFAEDNLCELAEDILTVSGRRSRFLGPDGSYSEFGNPINNLVSDFYYSSATQARTVERLLARGSDDTSPGPSRDARTLVKGYRPATTSTCARPASNGSPTHAAAAPPGCGRSARSTSGDASTASRCCSARARC
jgi:hypothetical protein